MNQKKMDRIISSIREEMMTTQSTPGKPGFSSAAPAKGPTAGFDPVMGKPITRIKLPPGSRRNWLKALRKKDEKD
jgi:hypothetical protein|tara:strand:- start:37 stop:261 length:225 start_codon:yes stop_codon:yes gene_type:complete